MCGSSWPISYRHSSFWHDFSHHKNIPPYGHKRSPPISGCSRWNTPEDYVCAPQLWMNPNVRSLRENWDQGLSFLCPELSCLTPLGPSFLIHKMTFPSKAKGLQLSPVYLHSGFSLKWSTELWMTNTKTTNWIRSLWGRNSTSKNSTVQPCVENPWPWLQVSVKKNGFTCYYTPRCDQHAPVYEHSHTAGTVHPVCFCRLREVTSEKAHQTRQWSCPYPWVVRNF